MDPNQALLDDEAVRAAYADVEREYDAFAELVDEGPCDCAVCVADA